MHNTASGFLQLLHKDQRCKSVSHSLPPEAVTLHLKQVSVLYGNRTFIIVLTTA